VPEPVLAAPVAVWVRLHYRMTDGLLLRLVIGCLLGLLVAGCTVEPDTGGVRRARVPPSPSVAASPDGGVPSALMGRWRLTGSSPQAWPGLDFRPDGLVVLDRGVATYSGSYSWSTSQFTVESAGLRYTFDAKLDPAELTLRNREFGTVVYRRADR
jgi:hypothetical protein